MAKGMEKEQRTLVEFYDQQYLENIISLLCGDYAGVVYVCFHRANIPTEEDKAALTEYVRNNFGFTPRFLEIRENTVESTLKGLRSLVNGGGWYDFDLTGGSAVFAAAAGALAAADGGGRLCLHEYDPVSGKRRFTYPHPGPADRACAKRLLTVDNVLKLRGIQVLHPQRPVRYDLGREDLRGQVLKLWETIRGCLKAWNAFSVLPCNIQQGPECFLVEKQMNRREREVCAELVEKLEKSGIITHVREDRQGGEVRLSYRLRVPGSALFLYDKGGNILEMLAYVTAVDSGRFTDCCTGICLDWDAADRHAAADPYNEIDTVLTRGHIPCFISCKNTQVENDYLYEIMVMARHYGGRYAVPGMLCTTRCNIHLQARAKEMGIVLIDDVARLNAEEFSKTFIAALCGE